MIEVKPILVVHKGRGQVQAQAPPGELAFGNRKFPWLAIDSLCKDGDEWVASLLSGERFASKTVRLPGVSFGAGRGTQLATADRIEVRLLSVPPTEVAYELGSHSGATVHAPIRGRIKIEETPKGLMPNLNRQLARADLRQPVVIESVVRENLQIGVLPQGVALIPQSGQPAGMEDERGRYVLVNGERWHLEPGDGRQTFMNPGVGPALRIPLGMRVCQIHLLWARPEGKGAARWHARGDEGGTETGGVVYVDDDREPGQGADARCRGDRV